MLHSASSLPLVMALAGWRFEFRLSGFWKTRNMLRWTCALYSTPVDMIHALSSIRVISFFLTLPPASLIPLISRENICQTLQIPHHSSHRSLHLHFEARRYFDRLLTIRPDPSYIR